MKTMRINVTLVSGGYEFGQPLRCRPGVVTAPLEMPAGMPFEPVDLLETGPESSSFTLMTSSTIFTFKLSGMKPAPMPLQFVRSGRATGNHG